MSRRPVRIANFSGYLGDRYTGLAEALAGDPVDVLVGDYLAEITLAGLAGRQRQGRPGYVEYFLHQLAPQLATMRDRGVKLVCNAGGFDPAGLAAVVRHEIARSGAGLTVAHVEGDDVLADLDRLVSDGNPLEHLDTGAPLTSWGIRPIAANAYLGGWGITAALRAGADIVVTGRVADASLVSGPAAWWHGWAEDDWDRLAGAVVAGHVIECGPQAVGGNFSGFTALGDMTRPGFPIAEIAADGSGVVTKHARDGGRVTVDTVTAQLLYEIQGPLYLNPDVTVDLSGIRLAETGPDRVAVGGAAGLPAPATTKVALFGLDGHQVVNTVYATGPDVEAKVALLADQLHLDLPEGVELTVTALGSAAPDPATQWDATVPVRVMATAADEAALAEFAARRRLGSLYLQTFPGFFHDGAGMLANSPSPRIDYWPAVLDASAVEHRVVHADGRTEVVGPLAGTTPAATQPEHPEPADSDTGVRTTRTALAELVHTRSGDKGGNSNLGVWAADERVWPWLRSFLSTDELRRLLPETKELEIVRHEFPELRAVHFVLRGLLGTGGSSNTRVDQVGKAVGEYLRAKHVEVPEDLVRDLARSR
ncbi:acyclic terpene utilization AtuA family protein [Pseudonocardia pini]|uniref:acyclic terpene utilization AtuA family protein n=1 Tax=Pseudonocardia pini TaxID=2758030 RepID=UPI0015F09BE3|nr:acyclic terpene utilization AtuA family protein [Pseudonocardia pini]